MTTFIDKYELQLVAAAEKTKKENHMYESPIKTRIRSTIRFVQRHQTLCACAATALITARLTRDSEIAALKETTIYLLNADTEQARQAAAMLQDCVSFIDARGLTDEFFRWAPRLRQEQ